MPTIKIKLKDPKYCQILIITIGFIIAGFSSLYYQYKHHICETKNIQACKDKYGE